MISYTNTGAGTGKPHYGVRFRATLIFIDEWQNGIGVIFSENSVQVHAYYYSMEEIIGVYSCGRNYYDHEDVVDFTFSHTGDDLSFSI